MLPERGPSGYNRIVTTAVVLALCAAGLALAIMFVGQNKHVFEGKVQHMVLFQIKMIMCQIKMEMHFLSVHIGVDWTLFKDWLNHIEIEPKPINYFDNMKFKTINYYLFVCSRHSHYKTMHMFIESDINLHLILYFDLPFLCIRTHPFLQLKTGWPSHLVCYIKFTTSKLWLFVHRGWYFYINYRSWESLST